MHLNNRRLSTLEMKGRIHFRENNSDLFYKVYKKDHLLDESGSIENRIRQIHKLSSAMAFMPKTSFSYEGDFLVMQQKLLIREKECAVGTKSVKWRTSHKKTKTNTK